MAPVIGGQLLTVATWRAVFIVLAAAGAVLLLAVLLALPESLPAPRRQPARLHHTARSLAGLARDWRYLRYVLASALMFAAVFAYISGSSFVLQQAYGLSAQQFSLIFAANGLGMVLLGQLSGFLVGRVATNNTLLRVSLTARRTRHRRPDGRHHGRLRRRCADHPPHPPALNRPNPAPHSARHGPTEPELLCPSEPAVLRAQPAAISAPACDMYSAWIFCSPADPGTVRCAGTAVKTVAVSGGYRL